MNSSIINETMTVMRTSNRTDTDTAAAACETNFKSEQQKHHQPKADLTTTTTKSQIVTIPLINNNNNNNNSVCSVNCDNKSHSNKTQTILNWLRSAEATPSEAATPSQLTRSHLTVNKCFDASDATVPIAAEGQRKQNHTVTNAYHFSESYGVQTLRRLWNKRISAHREAAGVRQTTTASTADDNNRSGSSADRTSTETNGVHCTDNHLDFRIHLEKDNFYKYKTAEQTSRKLQQLYANNKNLTLKLAVRSADKAGNRQQVDVETKQSINMSTTEAQREDGDDRLVIGACQLIEAKAGNCTCHTESDSGATTTSPSSAKRQNRTHDDDKPKFSTAADRNSLQNHFSQHESACEAGEASVHSLTTDAITTGGVTTRSPARCSSVVATKRKYSFKTRSRTYHYNNQRKMHGNAIKDVNGVPSVSSQFSMVAQLTQQFNDIIQKDKTLLKEVQRKNGVLMTRGGYVYKVVEATTLGSKAISNSRCQQSAVKPHSIVQHTIRKFENCKTACLENGKPKVPVKSIQVLRKGHELAMNKQHNRLRREAKPNLPSMKRHDYIHSPAKTVEVSSQLEPVKEEMKTNAQEPEHAQSCISDADKPSGYSNKHADDLIIAATQTETVETNLPEPVISSNADATQNAEQGPSSYTNEVGEDGKEESNDMKALEEKAQRRKEKYAKIYEKLRFRSPFSNKKLQATDPLNPTYSTTANSNIPSPADLTDDLHTTLNSSKGKILDALALVDEKIKDLSLQANAESSDITERLIPNESFIFQTSGKKTNYQPSMLLAQAINVTLVNSQAGNGIFKLQHSEEDSLYEPISPLPILDEPTSKPNASFGHEKAKVEDIYQTVDEVNTTESLNTSQTIEAAQGKCNSAAGDDYEELSPPSAPDTSINKLSMLTVRHTTDDLPNLPKPKRRLPKSPMPFKKNLKPNEATTTSSAVASASYLSLSSASCSLSSSSSSSSSSYYCTGDQQDYYADDENIYDTIKSSNCYESISACTNSKTTSNDYESITNYHRHSATNGSITGSIITAASEQTTNSLYEVSSIASETLRQHQSATTSDCYTTLSHRSTQTSNTNPNACDNTSGRVSSTYMTASSAGSDNSDDWLDITDNENNATENHPQFIVVRGRSKAHKSPDWSKSLRDKTLKQQKQTKHFTEDDPDHYYEQLSPKNLSKRHSLHTPSKTDDFQRSANGLRASKRGKQFSCSAHTLGQTMLDEFDSFDSDTDDLYDSIRLRNGQNVSGVDVCNMKLPNPPATTNQMVAIVRKFKNFMVNKKPSSSLKRDVAATQQKIYTDDSICASIEAQRSDTVTRTADLLTGKELSTSETNLLTGQVHTTASNTSKGRNKTSKSIRSRIRKSLVNFDTKQMSTLPSTRSTFYVLEHAADDVNEEMDSGFSEKTCERNQTAKSSEQKKHCSLPLEEGQRFSTAIRKSKRDSKLVSSQRRRTTSGLRPHNPPPPPPPPTSQTSWYDECGVFKNGSTSLMESEQQLMANSQNGLPNGSGSGSSTENKIPSTLSWYEEAGLYQTSGVSVISSSGSSGVSTGNEAMPGEDLSHRMFSNEPFYQIYDAAKFQAISNKMKDNDNSSSDGYEEIGINRHGQQQDDLVNSSEPKISRPTALQLIEPKYGPTRTLWSEIPEVIASGVLHTLTHRERILMEAKFEIITSEASYSKSLNLLRTHYINTPIFRNCKVISKADREALFYHIIPVQECCEKLLSELESCWQDNIMLVGLSKRVYTMAEKHFNVYIDFCKNQGHMDRTLQRLRDGRSMFAQTLEALEANPQCCGLNLHSFLMLPMQRITRWPLLIDAIFSKCHPDDDEYEDWKICLAIMNKIVSQCNEAANRSEQAYEIKEISKQLEFNPAHIRPLAIAPVNVGNPNSRPRYLVKRGELTHLTWRGEDTKLTFGKKISKSVINAFLFSDLLVLSKRKGLNNFTVFDYCPRSMLTITSGDSLPQLPTKDLNSQSYRNLILMTLLENHEHKTLEMIMSCPSVSEQERWLQAMRPPESETPGEKLYEEWDCPQVVAKHAYEAKEPDILSLQAGDVVNVTRKLPDGWYHGERIRDGAIGWFPGNYTEEVNSAHVRARNLKQRHRLLTFTATYLESQKRNK